MKNVNWTRILTILLVILAGYAVLYVTGTILGRFRHVIVIFVLGALTAYVLSPLVNRLEMAFRVRWIAILVSYLMLALGIFALGLFLFTPFVQQSQSLIDNLHTPTETSLHNFVVVQHDARTVRCDLLGGSDLKVCDTLTLQTRTSDRATVEADIGALQTGLQYLEKEPVSSHTHGAEPPPRPSGRQPANPSSQTAVPSSYLKPIADQIAALQSAYAAAGDPSQTPQQHSADVAQALAAASRVEALARQKHGIMAATPILLIHAQSWLDDHGIAIDVHDKFGQAAQQLSNQGSNLLDNAVTILQETANTLLNITLILIIAFYFLVDGRRIVRRSVDLVPAGYRDQVWYFASSLDRVLGGYIRGQLFLSALAGVLGGAGAAALGVPYPLLIGILTFLLESVPVIGPIVALLPAVIVSLVFEPVLTTILLLAWNIIFQQLVTNIIGPRLLGIAVGIHPLEAMLAVLVGYPLGGFLGAFLAVPVAGILHIVIREYYHYFVHGRALPTATPDEGLEPEPAVSGQRSAVSGQ